MLPTLEIERSTTTIMLPFIITARSNGICSRRQTRKGKQWWSQRTCRSNAKKTLHPEHM